MSMCSYHTNLARVRLLRGKGSEPESDEKELGESLNCQLPLVQYKTAATYTDCK